jgi:hypothetical protein
VTSLPDPRASLWTYYDRRAPEYDGGVEGAYRYFRSLGVDVDLEALRAERRAVTLRTGAASTVCLRFDIVESSLIADLNNMHPHNGAT